MNGVISWFRQTWTRRPLPLDIAVYATCLGYALLQATTSQFYGFRVWGNCALCGYTLALLHSTWLLLRTRARKNCHRPWHSRWGGIAAVGALAMLLPLAILVIRRLGGGAWHDAPLSWSAQPEVWVIERSARLLLDSGSPYTDITTLAQPEVYDYTPYGPVMSLFGIPNALFGHGAVTTALTDARLFFALTAVGCVAASLWLLGWPAVPIRAAQLAVVCPLTALTWSVAGPDLAVLGLILLATTLAVRQRPVAAAVTLALATSAKLIALPAVVVITVFVFTTREATSAWRIPAMFAATYTAVNLPVILANPGAYLENVVQFPLGLAELDSPAASPLPGHLLAQLGVGGHVAALALLACAAVLVTGWLLRQPPVSAADVTFRLAVGLTTFTVFAPATRFGYLVYPTVLLGATVCFSLPHQYGEQRAQLFLPRVAPPRPRN